jgi:hypothetical protein
MTTGGGRPPATQAPKAPPWMATQARGAQDSSPSNLWFGGEFDEGEY